MARKNIFELVSTNTTFEDDLRRLKTLIFSEECIQCYGIYKYSISEFVDKYLFSSWEQRQHCVDLDDFLKTLKYNELYEKALKQDFDSSVCVLELYYNLWNLVFQYILKSDDTKHYESFNFVNNLLRDCLSAINYTYHFFGEDTILLVEDKPEITAVAEIVDDDLALDIIRYNHHSLAGDIESKKSILLRLGSELEPKRKELKVINKQLEDNIFYMLNNLNLRHNNRSKKDKNYKEYVAKMKKSKLEDWYDELYQEILLAMLLLDDKNRQIKISGLKDKINTTKQVV